MQPEQPIYTDPGSGRRYSVDPSTGRSYWLPDPDTDLGTDTASGTAPAHGRTPRVSPGKVLLIIGGGLAALLVTVGAVGSMLSPSPGTSIAVSAPLSTSSPAPGSATAGPTPAVTAPTDQVTAAAVPTSVAHTSASAARTSPTTKASRSAKPASPTARSAPSATKRSTPKPPVTKFTNCTALNKVYPHGVGRAGAVDHTSGSKPVTNFTVNSAVYGANTGRDRDHDGIACEKA